MKTTKSFLYAVALFFVSALLGWLIHFMKEELDSTVPFFFGAGSILAALLAMINLYKSMAEKKLPEVIKCLITLLVSVSIWGFLFWFDTVVIVIILSLFK